jgi:ABC-type phosphate/phosphonate transport system substrate-binding protein
MAVTDATPVASLPMYDWPEIAWANDVLWAAIAARLTRRGIRAPPALNRSRKTDAVWRDPTLLLSQTCGYPFATRLRGMVKLVGTPTYDALGCDGPFYSSIVVVRTDEPADRLAELAGRRVAFNSSDSLSGYVAFRQTLREAVDPAAIEWIETGSHRASVRAVAEGEADVAAIDSVCWSLAQRHEPAAVSRLRVLDATPLRPGLPFITAVERPVSEIKTIRFAIKDAIADPSTREAADALGLTGISVLDEWHYGPIAKLACQTT